MENERKDAFKRMIMEAMRAAGAGKSVPKADILAAARSQEPALFDDSETCYPGCGSKHPKWRHEFDRCIYDLTATRPAKIRTDKSQPGTYRLGP